MRYLENRGLIPPTPRKIWAFLGDGEMDEPESMGSLTLASREKLDNLIFVINCNLQRLDGPVRGNGKVIQELEAAFRGAGWNVIKVIWGEDWDALLARDTTGLLQKRMGEVVDGEYQTYITKDGAYIRKNFFGKYPELLDLVAHLSDDELMQAAARRPRSAQGLQRLQGGGGNQRPAHRDPGPHHQGLRPGRGGRGPQHHPPAEEAQRAGDRALPVALRDPHSGRSRPQCRILPAALGQPGNGLPARAAAPAGWIHAAAAPPWPAASRRRRSITCKESLEGSAGREVSSTMAFVRVLTLLMKHPRTGQARGAHHSRRGAHVRHGIAVPPVRHLCQPGTALQAARRGDVPVLQGIQGRPDSRRGHHRSRFHGFLHGRGHGLRELRRGHDPVLHLLLDVRLPARGRPDLGIRRLARQRLPVRRHRRPHHPGRRRLAAPGWPQHPALQHSAHLRHLRPGLRL